MKPSFCQVNNPVAYRSQRVAVTLSSTHAEPYFGPGFRLGTLGPFSYWFLIAGVYEGNHAKESISTYVFPFNRSHEWFALIVRRWICF